MQPFFVNLSIYQNINGLTLAIKSWTIKYFKNLVLAKNLELSQHIKYLDSTNLNINYSIIKGDNYVYYRKKQSKQRR